MILPQEVLFCDTQMSRHKILCQISKLLPDLYHENTCRAQDILPGSVVGWRKGYPSDILPIISVLYIACSEMVFKFGEMSRFNQH